MIQKKIIFLFCALLLPVAVFLFLKSFGKNEFDVKPLFQTSVQVGERCAEYSYRFPYTIPDSLRSFVFQETKDTLTLIVLTQTLPDIEKHLSVQLERIFKESSLGRVFLLHDGESNTSGFDSRVTIKDIGVDNFLSLKYCALLLSSEQSAVLIDSQGRVRGQYNLSELDEVDRLIMEAKIILKQY